MNYLRKELIEEPNVNVELDSDFETQILSMRSFLHDVRNRMENLESTYEDEILKLNSEIGEQRLYTDSTGVNLCLEITKDCLT